MTTTRKTRVRNHVIADISENSFERHALLKGFSVEKITRDYGYDLNMYTYNSDGEIENGRASIQLKASDSLRYISNETEVSFTLSKRDLDLWLREFDPVILAVYDTKDSANPKGYWVYVQKHFDDIDLNSDTNTVNVRIPISNKVSKGAMTEIAKLKSKLYSQAIDIVR